MNVKRGNFQQGLRHKGSSKVWSCLHNSIAEVKHIGMGVRTEASWAEEGKGNTYSPSIGVTENLGALRSPAFHICYSLC